MSEWMSRLIAKYTEVNEKMDPVDKAELKGKHKDRNDKDINNDGDVDSSDEYLHKRRKAVSKAVDEEKCKECDCDDCECEKNEAYNEPQGQAKRMMSPLQKARMDKEKADRDRDGKLKPGVIKKEDKDLDEISLNKANRLDPTHANKMIGKSIKGHYHEAKEVNEISVGKVMKYGKAAAKDIEKHRNTVKTALDQPASPKKADAGLKSMKTLRKRSRGSDMYVNKLTGRSKVKPTAEAYENIKKATHQGPSSPPGEGLSPSAKDQLAKKMPTPEPIDEPKVDAKNFATFRKGLKAAPKRPGDNNKGDKNVVK